MCLAHAKTHVVLCTLPAKPHARGHCTPTTPPWSPAFSGHPTTGTPHLRQPHAGVTHKPRATPPWCPAFSGHPTIGTPHLGLPLACVLHKPSWLGHFQLANILMGAHPTSTLWDLQGILEWWLECKVRLMHAPYSRGMRPS